MSRDVDNQQSPKDPLQALVALVRDSCHSISNPLTAILGETQLLLLAEDALSEEQRAGLRTVESMAYRIRDLVAQLRDAARAAADEEQDE